MSRIDMLVVGLCLVFGYGIVTWWLSLKKPDAPDQALLESSAKEEAYTGAPWWQVLGLLEEASWPQIEQAYQAKLRQYTLTDPDGMGTALVELAQQQTRQIEAAYRQAQRVHHGH